MDITNPLICRSPISSRENTVFCCPSCWSNHFYHQGARLQNIVTKSNPWTPNTTKILQRYCRNICLSLQPNPCLLHARLFLTSHQPGVAWVDVTFLPKNPSSPIESPEKWDSFQLSGCFPPTAQWSSCLVGASHQPFSHWWMNFGRESPNLRNGSGYVLFRCLWWTLKWEVHSQRLAPDNSIVPQCNHIPKKVKMNDEGTLHTLGKVLYCKSTIISFKRHKWTILLQICPVTPSFHNFPSTKWQ